MSQVEKDIWLNIVIQHPDGLYGADIKDENSVDGETIANSRFKY